MEGSAPRSRRLHLLRFLPFQHKPPDGPLCSSPIPGNIKRHNGFGAFSDVICCQAHLNISLLLQAVFLLETRICPVDLFTGDQNIYLDYL